MVPACSSSRLGTASNLLSGSTNILQQSFRLAEQNHCEESEMKSYFVRYALLCTVPLVTSSANGAEKKVAMKDLPAPVQKAVAEESKGAVLRGLTKEVENGKTEYEAELTVNGQGKDISFDTAGNVTS